MGKFVGLRFLKYLSPFWDFCPWKFCFGALRSTYGEEFTFIPSNMIEQIFTEVLIPFLVSILFIEFYLWEYQNVFSSYIVCRSYPFVNFTGDLLYITFIDILITCLFAQNIELKFDSLSSACCVRFHLSKV